MDEPAANRWAGKAEEDVLLESFHEIRNPVYIAVGYLEVLKSTNQLSLSAEQVQQFTEAASQSALQAKEIVDSVYQYIHTRKAP